MAGQAQARRLARDFVVVPRRVGGWHHRTGGDRAGDRRLRSGLDPGGPGPGRRRHVGRLLVGDPPQVIFEARYQSRGALPLDLTDSSFDGTAPAHHATALAITRCTSGWW